jgi:multidrug efflux pump subunit AcrA (membrane-fusion protein)
MNGIRPRRPRERASRAASTRRAPSPSAAAAALLLAGLLLAGCDRPAATGAAPPTTSQSAGSAPAAPTNRIDIPAPVRSNLGMTFVKVEARHVAQTLRVPGRFELLPAATREYRTMLAGRVELLVDQYDHVEAGQPLYRIDSLAWRAMQAELSEAEAQIQRLGARLDSYSSLRDAHRQHREQLQHAVAIRNDRLAQLESVAGAGGGRAGELLEARAAVAEGRSQLAELIEKEATLQADQADATAELAAARARRALLIESAASLLGATIESLERMDEDGRPGWRATGRITVTADAPGVVDSIGLASGGWATETTTVLTVVQPERLRFRASVLQSDLAQLRDGQPARIVAPVPTRARGSVDLLDTMPGTLRIAPGAQADRRAVDVLVVPETLSAWARAGVTAQLEITVDATARPALAIPRAAVHRDGLHWVYFRRDPRDPDKAIRVEADLGVDDGRWIVVNSGLRLGDEVVLDGSYQLMLATSASGGASKSGHFHADGTWHEGEH